MMQVRSGRPHEILLPVKPTFIFLTLLFAMILNMLPWYGTALLLRPDFVALVLLYWCIHQPRRIGIMIAWMLGLLMDVADGNLFGQHALAYTVLAYVAIYMHRRILMFGMLGQVLHMFPILFVAQAIILIIRLFAGASFPGWIYFGPSVLGTLLWPILSILLQLPQHQRVDVNQK